MAIDDAAEFDKRRMRREELKYKRNKERKRTIIGLVIAAAVLVAAAVLIFVFTRKPPQQDPQPTGTVPTGESAPEQTSAPTEPSVPETEPPRRKQDTVIHFAAAGDLNVNALTVEAGGAAYDFAKTFRDVLPVLSAADLTVVNFEGNLIGVPYGTESVSAPQKMMEALAEAGVDLIQMANSKAIVNGTIGLGTTLDNIRAAGMEPVGAYASNAEFKKSGGYIIRDVQGIKVAIVAFTKGMDGMALPAGSENCVNLLYTDYSTTYQDVDTKGISKILKAINKQKPDITIALLHWGSEYNDNLNETQDDILDLMFDYGVDAVIGTHPHYVQEIQYNESKGTLVAYSLGDFFSDTQKAGTEYSILLDLEITKDADTEQTKITGYSYTPLFTVAEEGEPLKVVRLKEAMLAYEEGYVDRVSQEIYEDMEYALTRIEERVNPPEE